MRVSLLAKAERFGGPREFLRWWARAIEEDPMSTARDVVEVCGGRHEGSS